MSGNAQELQDMINESIIDVDAAVERLRQQLKKSNDYKKERVGKLREVYLKLTSIDDEDELDYLEEEASELAEELEIQFIYTRQDGKRRVYSPQAHWEPSGGCEWTESAQYGYDYGWQI